MNKTVLLLDDKAHIRRDLGKRLTNSGYSVHKAEGIEESKKIILAEKIDFAIIDLKVDYTSEYGGVEIVNFVKRHQPRVKTIILSAYSLADSDKIPALNGQFIDGYVSKKGPENYILAVINQLSAFEGKIEKKECFVIMPFSDTESCTKEEWSEIFHEVIKPAIEMSENNFSCTRSQAIQGSIIEDILDNLNRADLVVADLTNRNANVFYELGVRHSLRDNTLLIAQHLDDIPFDLRHFAIQTYSWKTKKGKNEFRKKIKEILKVMTVDPKKGTSPVRKYLGI